MNPALPNNDSLKDIRKGWVKCALCGFVFKEDQAQEACKSCPLMKGCKLIKCPNCGFETPSEPKWIRYLKSRAKLKYKRKETSND